MKVDFPAPLAPTSPTIPGSTETVRSWRAVTRPPYVLVKASVTMRLTADSLETHVTERDQVSPRLAPEFLDLPGALPGPRGALPGLRTAFLGPRSAFLGPRGAFLGLRSASRRQTGWSAGGCGRAR